MNITLKTSLDYICFLCPLVFVHNFELSSLLQSNDFDHSFKSGRKTRLFGSHVYSYGNTTHLPTNINSNPYIFEMFQFLTNAFPDLDLNSCLINYYPNSILKVLCHITLIMNFILDQTPLYWQFLWVLNVKCFLRNLLPI